MTTDTPDNTDAVLRISHADAGWGIIARKRVRAITGGREPTMEDYHAALVQCLKDKAAEIDRLRLRDAEREAVETSFDAMQYAADQLGLSQADCDRLVATLRGLLERTQPDSPQPIANCDSDSPQPIECTPATPSTPAECTVPPEWTARPYWVDPPEGWRWGFPRLYDPAKDGDMRAWMIATGYPEHLANQGLPCTFTAMTEDGEK